MDILFHSLKHGIMISVFVFVMMVFVDYLNVLTGGGMSRIIKGGRWRQYFIASFFGAVPGCLGSFMNVTFYVRGLISFGAIAGSMLATSGDAAFVMLAMFPGKAILLFIILFIMGIGFSFLYDKLAVFFKIKPCEECKVINIHKDSECRLLNSGEIIKNLKNISFQRFLILLLIAVFIYAFLTGIAGHDKASWQNITLVSLLFLTGIIVITVPEHYLEEHIWNHILKKHFWKILLWTVGALFLLDTGLELWNLEGFVREHMLSVIFLACLVGIIPDSGPHLIFVAMFAKGMVPFSVLLASSIVQDGHGMLPLLSYTIKDPLKIKLFNFTVGVLTGFILYSLGF